MDVVIEATPFPVAESSLPKADPCVILIFGGLLLTPFLIRRFSQPAGATVASGDVDSRTRYGFRLTESAKAAWSATKACQRAVSESGRS